MYLISVYEKETKKLVQRALVNGKDIESFLEEQVFNGDAEDFVIKMIWINKF